MQLYKFVKYLFFCLFHFKICTPQNKSQKIFFCYTYIGHQENHQPLWDFLVLAFEVTAQVSLIGVTKTFNEPCNKLFTDRYIYILNICNKRVTLMNKYKEMPGMFQKKKFPSIFPEHWWYLSGWNGVDISDTWSVHLKYIY